MKRFSAFILAVALTAIALPAFASGNKGGELECPGNTGIEKTVVRDAEGSEHKLLTLTVAEESQGREAVLTATAANNSSVHPGNDLIVASGSKSVVLVDVERAPGAVTEASDELVLGSELTITLVMGQDGVFSGDITIAVECPEPEPEPQEVGVMVAGFCVYESEEAIGRLEYSVDVGATLTIDGVGIFSGEAGAIQVEVDNTYAWSAVAQEGFVLVGAALGEVYVEDCTPEVPPTTTPTTVPPETTSTTAPPTTETTTPPPPTTIPPPNGDHVESQQSSSFPGATLLVVLALAAVVSTGAAVRQLRRN